MNDSNHIPVLERLYNMDRNQAGISRGNEQRMAVQNYAAAFQRFAQTVSGPCDLRCLQYPFLFFYLKEPKKKNSLICTIRYFQYGTRCKSNAITEKTFPSFLRNQCMVAEVSSAEATRMFQALSQLLRTYPRGVLEYLIEDMKRFDPGVAAILSQRGTVVLTKENNLCVSAVPNSWVYTSRDQFEFLPVIDDERCKWANVPEKLLQKTLKVLSEKCAENGDYIPNEAQRAECSAVFGIDAEEFPYIEAKYQPNSDSFECVRRGWANVQLKSMPLYHEFKMQAVSDELASVFRGLCGDSIAAIDALAKCVSRVMDPALPGMTIICAQKHKEKLQDIFIELFQEHIAVGMVPARNGKGNVFPSLNQLAKKQMLKQLFLAQFYGKSMVFVRDLTASDGNLKLLKKLIVGKKITLHSSDLPPQYYFNKLQIVCICDNHARAGALQTQFKMAEFIDLSICEQQLELPKLAERDLHWLKSTFLLYGLKLRTLERDQMPDPIRRTESKELPCFESEVERYLEQCEFGEGLHCDTHEVYDRFLAFYRSQHGESKIGTTKIKFNKLVRAIIEKKHARAVVYKKIRTPNAVNWQYVGMGLPKDPFPERERSETGYQNYLAHINTYALPNDFEPIRRARIVRQLSEG